MPLRLRSLLKLAKLLYPTSNIMVLFTNANSLFTKQVLWHQIVRAHAQYIHERGR